ncbi:hypothetical protein RRG08_003241 [Elysia crispata]|uniref:DNA-directed DNA polymerase n=1 Tax=Elysia crispata TaxID=231223 RepID=A0AAE1AZ39_9GAST|nr:hypothetical protein RRG08_003241 [Elysia crispata]
MEPYIRMNTELRKQATSAFEKDLYKLMNNSVFGKTMENLRKRVDVKLVRSHEEDKLRRLIASPSFARANIFDDDLAAIEVHKSRLVLQSKHLRRRPRRHRGPQEPSSPQPPRIRGHEHSRPIEDPNVRLLLRAAEEPVRKPVPAPLHRHRQPPPRDRDGGRLSGYDCACRSIRHVRLPTRAPSAQR